MTVMQFLTLSLTTYGEIVKLTSIVRFQNPIPQSSLSVFRSNSKISFAERPVPSTFNARSSISWVAASKYRTTSAWIKVHSSRPCLVSVLWGDLDGSIVPHLEINTPPLITCHHFHRVFNNVLIHTFLDLFSLFWLHGRGVAILAQHLIRSDDYRQMYCSLDSKLGSVPAEILAPHLLHDHPSSRLPPHSTYPWWKQFEAATC